MPAKNLLRISTEGTYFHVYNRGIEDKIIFKDSLDYQAFLGYLKEYLTPPANAEDTKKTFKVNGREYRGTPHQPKNYFDKVELVAYSLMPTHFSLLVQQKAKDSLQGFIRSLCTRYSMYFNKKYHRTGSLFAGPYKSAHIEERSQLVHLANYLHQGHEEYSSYPEYANKRQTSWIKPDVVLAQKEVEGTLSKKLIFEAKPRQTTAPEPVKSIEVKQNHLPVFARIPEIATITVVFLVLLSVGIRNIAASGETSEVLGISAVATPTVTPQPTDPPKIERKVVVKITDGATIVNIRKSPKVRSEKIGEAKDGDTFEFLSVTDGWYEIKLENGSSGFILGTYLREESNN